MSSPVTVLLGGGGVYCRFSQGPYCALLIHSTAAYVSTLGGNTDNIVLLDQAIEYCSLY